MEEVENWDPVHTIFNSPDVVVYPNPVRRDSADDRLTIYSPEIMDNVRIYDLSGLLVYERQDIGNARSLAWNLKNQHDEEVVSGIYICVVGDATGATTVRKIAIIK